MTKVNGKDLQKNTRRIYEKSFLICLFYISKKLIYMSLLLLSSSLFSLLLTYLLLSPLPLLFGLFCPTEVLSSCEHATRLQKSEILEECEQGRNRCYTLQSVEKVMKKVRPLIQNKINAYNWTFWAPKSGSTVYRVLKCASRLAVGLCGW